MSYDRDSLPAARIKPAAKFWKAASTNAVTLIDVNTIEAIVIDTVGIAPTRKPSATPVILPVIFEEFGEGTDGI